MIRSAAARSAALALTLVALSGCTPATGGGHEGHAMDPTASAQTAQLESARAATSGFTDVPAAESAGYASTRDSLGCFQDAEHGGMGLHYLREDLLDATLDATTPEALVYELDASGRPGALVAHEYIVPVEAWHSSDPPELYGMALHRHPSLPLWVLHAWVYRDNPGGMFADFNPNVTQCPAGVPVFGVDLP